MDEDFSPVTDYARRKILSALKCIGHAWDEEVAKDSLDHQQRDEQRVRTIKLYEKYLLAWYKREHLEHSNLGQILERLKSEKFIISWTYYEDESEVGPYWKESYWEILLPRDFGRLLEKYKSSLEEPEVEVVSRPLKSPPPPPPVMQLSNIRIVVEEDEDKTPRRKVARPGTKDTAVGVSGNFVNYGHLTQVIVPQISTTIHTEPTGPRKSLLRMIGGWCLEHLAELVFTSIVLALASYAGVHWFGQI